jgi:hypothetical protein
MEPHRLLDIAVVIRSKDAGVNRLTFDILFTSAENYEAALRSNVFYKDNMATILDLPRERLVGTFFVDTCNAVKISIERPNISASMDERDVFGAQQQSAIERLTIPGLCGAARQGVGVLVFGTSPRQRSGWAFTPSTISRDADAELCAKLHKMRRRAQPCTRARLLS